jgi:hypothetical protein
MATVGLTVVCGGLKMWRPLSVTTNFGHDNSPHPFFITKILCRVYPLLGNDSVYTFPREPTRTKIGRLLLHFR